jgi:hypothetical protein
VSYAFALDVVPSKLPWRKWSDEVKESKDGEVVDMEGPVRPAVSIGEETWRNEEIPGMVGSVEHIEILEPSSCGRFRLEPSPRFLLEERDLPAYFEVDDSFKGFFNESSSSKVCSSFLAFDFDNDTLL